MTLGKADIGFFEATGVVAVTTANQVMMTIDLSPWNVDSHGIYFLITIVPLRHSPIECDCGSIWAVYAAFEDGNSGWTTLTAEALKAPVDAFVDFNIATNSFQVRIDGGTIAMPVAITARGSLFYGTP